MFNDVSPCLTKDDVRNAARADGVFIGQDALADISLGVAPSDLEDVFVSELGSSVRPSFVFAAIPPVPTLYARPMITSYDERHRGLGDVVLICEAALGDSSRLVSLPNVSDLHGAQLRPVAPLSSLGDDPPLPRLIGGVVLMCAQKPVRRVLTRWVIAGVAYTHAVRDRCDESLITNPMGFELSTAGSESTVSRGVPAGCPWPAFRLTSPVHVPPPVVHGVVAHDRYFNLAIGGI